MEVTLVAQEGGVVRLRAAGDITHTTLAESPDPIGRLLGKDGFAQTVLLSLEKVSFMDSSGVGWLLGCRRRFREGGGQFVLHSIPPNILEILQVMRLEQVLRLAPDETTALALAQGQVQQAPRAS